MVNKNYVATSQRSVAVALAVALMTMLLTVVIGNSPAFAACNGSQSSFGCETGGGGDGGVDNGTPAPPSTPGTGTPNPGTPGPSAPVDPYLSITRIVPANGACPVDQGRNALGLDIYYTKITEFTNSRDVGPAGGNFTFDGYYPGYGYLWSAKVEVMRDCLYGPLTYTITHTCYIETSATITRTKPSFAIVGSNKESSGFAQGSSDYYACMNSSSRAGVFANIQEYGFYVSEISSRAQIATIEVAYTPNELTGITPAPKIVGLSAVFTTSPAGKTGSLTCLGWSSPGLMLADYTDTSMCEKTTINPNGFFQCTSGSVPSVNGLPSNGATNSSGVPSVVQIMGDGNRNKVTFNQKVVGEDLTIKSYSTQFSLSDDSVPFDNNVGGFANPNGLLTELFRSPTDNASQNIMRTTRNTALQSGRVDDIYIAAYTESEMHQITEGLQALKLTQRLFWAGTLMQDSVEVIAVDGDANMITVPAKLPVDVSGVCDDQVVTQSIRAHGDKIG